MTPFKLTDETIIINGKTLYRIELTANCQWGEKGTKGGFIESTHNLMQNAWVSDDAMVFDKANVCGNAEISGNAQIYGKAVVSGNARVSGNACVCDYAMVSDNAGVSDNAHLSGNVTIYDNAQVYGNAKVSSDALVYGKAIICGDAIISHTSHYMIISSLGHFNRTLTITFSDKMIVAGCFRGSLDEFKTAVDKKYNGKGNYYPAITFIESLFKNS